MKILFVCTANKLRSPTAEAVFAEYPGLEVRSAGLDPQAPKPLTAELVAWADRLLVMEQRHRDVVRKRFRQELDARPVIVLGIPDDYEFMQEELVTLLKERVPQFLD
ncbi:MAG: phosphotyrosine protein phosphatase [Pseudomonadota bacterium]